MQRPRSLLLLLVPILIVNACGWGAADGGTGGGAGGGGAVDGATGGGGGDAAIDGGTGGGHGGIDGGAQCEPSGSPACDAGSDAGSQTDGGAVVCEPGASPTCNACVCETCPQQFASCDAIPDCPDDVGCAQTMLGNGTCDRAALSAVELITCINAHCGLGGTNDAAVEPQAVALLICVEDTCSAPCSPPVGP